MHLYCELANEVVRWERLVCSLRLRLRSRALGKQVDGEVTSVYIRRRAEGVGRCSASFWHVPDRKEMDKSCSIVCVAVGQSSDGEIDVGLTEPV